MGNTKKKNLCPECGNEMGKAKVCPFCRGTGKVIFR